MPDALVLSGGVAKSAFSAGVLSVLTEPAVRERAGIDFTRLVATSSGALNAVFYGAAIHAGTDANAGARMAELWIDDATLLHALRFSLREILTARALGTSDNLLAWLRAHIEPSPRRRSVELRVIATNADGRVTTVAREPATTYEQVIELGAPDFESRDAIERLFRAVAASMALPGLYAPAELEIDGRTAQVIDGSLTDNTPLGHAIRGAPRVDRVFVISPFPRVQAPRADLHGLAIASHVLNILVQERLFRDLRDLAHVNHVLARLERVVPDARQRAEVLEALGWTGRRPVEVVEIRPPEELPGDVFAGFWSRGLRQEYVAAGVEAGRRAVARLAL